MTTLYTASATATGEGRNGHVATDDGLIDMKLAVPVEMGGAGGATNPEQLFASGYAACFHSALQLVARKARVDLGASTVSAQVGIGPAGAGFGLSVALTIAAPTVETAVLEELVSKAHQVCPYSNATRGNIDVALNVTTAPALDKEQA